MPYYTKKDKNQYCVYKKEDDTKVGCTTKAKLNKYLAALHTHEGTNKIAFNIGEEMDFKYVTEINETSATIHLYDLIGEFMTEDGSIKGINGNEVAKEIAFLSNIVK